MGAYDYNGMGDKEVSYSILQMIHVYLANIILLNLLIAILTEIMELVGEKSTFKYLVNLYTYCERYMIAFENENFGKWLITKKHFLRRLNNNKLTDLSSDMFKSLNNLKRLWVHFWFDSIGKGLRFLVWFKY